MNGVLHIRDTYIFTDLVLSNDVDESVESIVNVCSMTLRRLAFHMNCKVNPYSLEVHISGCRLEVSYHLCD